MILRFCVLSMILQGISFGLCTATEDSSHFPNLGLLPKKSIIRQTCLEPNSFAQTEDIRSACENLEKHAQLCVTGEDGWELNVRKPAEEARRIIIRLINNGSKDPIETIMDNASSKLEKRARQIGIDPKNKSEFHKFVWQADAFEKAAIVNLFEIGIHKYNAKNTVDTAIRQENLAAASELEAVFAKVDNLLETVVDNQEDPT